MKTIKLFFNDSRLFYTNKEYDITIIEIKKDDGLDLESFLEIDNINNNPIEYYNQKSVYLLQFPNDKEADFSNGDIKSLDNYTIYHTCNTIKGSSGSPIINILNNKVIGIHRGSKGVFNYNLGTLIKMPIEDFNLKKKRIKSINEIFKEIRDQKLDILYEINNKKQLFYLFVAVNNKIFHKKYFGEIF